MPTRLASSPGKSIWPPNSAYSALQWSLEASPLLFLTPLLSLQVLIISWASTPPSYPLSLWSLLPSVQPPSCHKGSSSSTLCHCHSSTPLPVILNPNSSSTSLLDLVWALMSSSVSCVFLPHTELFIIPQARQRFSGYCVFVFAYLLACSAFPPLST